MNPTEIFEKSFEKPIILDFMATWCNPCKKLAPILEAVAEKHGDKLELVVVDVDKEQDIAKEFSVMGMPTVLFIKDGEVVDSFTGGQTEAFVNELADSLVS